MRPAPAVRFAAASFVALLLLAAASAPHLAGPIADPRFDVISNLVQQKMKELNVPGVAIGVLADGEVRTRGFGVTNVDHPLSVTDDTLFQIGSITKTFTGTAMMRLVEQGKVRLDDPIRKHIPTFKVKDPDASTRATIRDTLTHMGGWEGDFFDDPSDGDDALDRIVERMATLEQTAKVGEMWGYNNAGFYAAGRIIEVVTRQPFERALRELVLDPLGMDSAFFFPADVMTRRFVVGHGVEKGLPIVLRPWPIPRAANAAGGITTTVGSMLRYASFHMGDGSNRDGTRVLSEASLNQMRSPIVAKAGSDLSMGLTWHLSRAGSVAIAEHGGGTTGQGATLCLVPERRFALAIVANSDRAAPLHTQVRRAMLETYLGLTLPRPPRMPVAAGSLQEYVGTYRRQYADVQVTVDGDALKFQVTQKMAGLGGKVPPPGPAQRLGFYSKDRLLRLDGPNAGEPGGEFVRDADGHVAWLRTGRIHRRIDTASTR